MFSFRKTQTEATILVNHKESYKVVLKEFHQKYKEPAYRQNIEYINNYNEDFDQVIYEIIDLNQERDLYWSMKYNTVLRELSDTIYTIEKNGFRLRPFIFMNLNYKNENNLWSFIKNTSIVDLLAMWFITSKIVENF